MIINKNGIDLNFSSVFFSFFFLSKQLDIYRKGSFKMVLSNFQWQGVFHAYFTSHEKNLLFLGVGSLARLGHCANSRQMIPAVETV